MSLITLREVTIGPFAGLPDNPNKTSGKHWASLYKDKKAWSELVGYSAMAAKTKARIKPFKQASVHFHISVGDNRPHDADNIISSLKPVLDALKGQLIEDDSIDHIDLSYSFDRVKPRQFNITVREK